MSFQYLWCLDSVQEDGGEVWEVSSGQSDLLNSLGKVVAWITDNFGSVTYTVSGAAVLSQNCHPLFGGKQC